MFRYLLETAQSVIDNGGESWLLGLRELSHIEVRQTLQKLSGVGPKVADCVALFSLDQCDTVPVDTHVRDICTRDYILNSATKAEINPSKTLTPAIYERVGNIFKERFHRKAGW